jgi:hypothetical protein
MYLAMGWDSIDEYYHTNWRVIRRWIDEEGRHQLRADRAAVVAEARRAKRATSTYLNRTAAQGISLR